METVKLWQLSPYGPYLQKHAMSCRTSEGASASRTETRKVQNERRAVYLQDWPTRPAR